MISSIFILMVFSKIKNEQVLNGLSGNQLKFAIQLILFSTSLIIVFKLLSGVLYWYIFDLYIQSFDPIRPPCEECEPRIFQANIFNPLLLLIGANTIEEMTNSKQIFTTLFTILSLLVPGYIGYLVGNQISRLKVNSSSKIRTITSIVGYSLYGFAILFLIMLPVMFFEVQAAVIILAGILVAIMMVHYVVVFRSSKKSEFVTIE